MNFGGGRLSIVLVATAGITAVIDWPTEGRDKINELSKVFNLRISSWIDCAEIRSKNIFKGSFEPR